VPGRTFVGKVEEIMQIKIKETKTHVYGDDKDAIL
jgi:hypothetical protein